MSSVASKMPSPRFEPTTFRTNEFLIYVYFVFNRSFKGCGESIKDSVFRGSVLGGSVFLTSDILR